ncbi:Acylamidase [Falsiruegeria litorea R37]|uniref:Acylamidase n=1 Tax=Falsiruegeria litorea R37 TaxID=1200284 RepID=A0A1Y5SBD5_9RHOB|nr:amidase [Falsiruegeria litorea]SLN36121.1 Acylamidase [Falsiruegeria litorea R37]
MELNQVSAVELVADLQAGRLTAAALMQATLERIAEVNGEVNAIVALRPADDLMQEAEAADRADARGPLHGLPIAIKDLVNVAGIASTSGSPALKDFVPETDDELARRLRATGAIVIGKTNTPEFGLGSHTFNPVYGATLNPYDATRSCGGSSGGAAVALATGMLALADGSDMMGSLRNPAAWNNVYGLRPSWGRVPSEPTGEMFLHQLSTLGPMARSPEDIGLLLDVLSGPDPRHPHGTTSAAASPVTPCGTEGLRIGWLGDWGGAIPMEDGILALCEKALGVFSDFGCQVELVPPPFSAEEMWNSWIDLRSWAVSNSLGALYDAQAELKDSAIWEIERGLEMSGRQIQHASAIRSNWFRCAAELFERYDALVLPSAQIWPFDVTQPYPTQINGVAMDTYHRWMQVTVPVSLIGLPALAMPAGFGTGGLPMGMQMFGKRGSDANLLALGAAYHAATQWPQSRPARPNQTKEAKQ